MLVQQEAMKFMFMVCRKSAREGFLQTWTAHMIKYTRTGTRQVDKRANSFISSEVKKNMASIE
jgi:hypothetical protein